MLAFARSRWQGPRCIFATVRDGALPMIFPLTAERTATFAKCLIFQKE